MNTTPNIYDLIIIGAGPAGLACAIEAQKTGLHYLVVDRGGIVNSIQRFQRNMFFFSTPDLLEIGNIPFVVSTTRPTALDCVNYYRGVAQHYNLACRFYEKVVSSNRRNGQFVLEGSKGVQYRSLGVVVATGYYDTPTSLGVQGEDLLHVSHYYQDPLPYFQQDVLIVGGKNSAVEAALDLYRHGARVTVVHRGAALSSGVKYWILPDFENRVADGSIKLYLNTVVEAFQQNCTILRDSTGKHWEHTADSVFILIGYRPDTAFLKSLGIEIDPDSLAPMHNPETMETNVLNLFVAGGMVGGRFNNKVYIENGREHGKKIVKCLNQ
ncbi:MAG TPA: YpdA family putative bacillithiol disulfide reductase [Bacteroidota bacterium]|nr:YpdA family putative bacillithiol disulfide reductase [Bacteroidota bacterium]